MSHVSARSDSVESFKVMEVVARATELERQGRSIMHLEVGQPQSGAPEGVKAAAAVALQNDRIGYTSSLGVLALRQRIAEHYQLQYSVQVPADRVAITCGSRRV